ncbi:surface carbohydrate biosynthesis protein [Mesorhizobium sp. AaZ16]|uniref:surface carbohydrate biosynthesis protein n=1 Tax=Mesorhizobium sp. AaZ16 TaxID=3402289 RepID=UPI00374F4273
MTKIAVSDRRWARLPVELSVRELDAKLLLAGVLADSGWGVLIGQEAQVRSARLPGPSVHYDKSIAPGMTKALTTALGDGSIFTANCEEGLVYLDAPTYVRRKISADNLAACSTFFCWGEHQADDLVATFGLDHARLILSGNPRVDLLRPEMRSFYEPSAKSIRERHGQFILFNTKFGRFNPFIGREKFYEMAKGSWGLIRTEEEDAKFRNSVRHQEETFEHTIRLIDTVAASRPDIAVIVRPHPSENWSTYLHRFGSSRGISVATAGSAVEWIAAASAMVHSDCTTGVEAFVLDRPSICYEPLNEADYDIELPRMLSLRCGTDDAVLGAIDAALAGRTLLDPAAAVAMAQTAQHHMANIFGQPAVNVIAERFEPFDLARVSLHREVAQQCFVNAVEVGDALVVDHHIDPSQQNYRAQKFPLRHADEIASTLGRLGRATGQFTALHVAELTENLFCVYRP